MMKGSRSVRSCLHLRYGREERGGWGEREVGGGGYNGLDAEAVGGLMKGGASQ